MVKAGVVIERDKAHTLMENEHSTSRSQMAHKGKRRLVNRAGLPFVRSGVSRRESRIARNQVAVARGLAHWVFYEPSTAAEVALAGADSACRCGEAAVTASHHVALEQST